MEKTIDKEKNKLYWDIDKVYGWDKNPRKISDKDFDRLKKQIYELGEYKPLLITPDGEVLGGNMRLRAYKELGFDKVWVSVVNAKNEAEKLKYALSDNDTVGVYVQDDLTSLFKDKTDILDDFEDYNIDLEESVSVLQLLKDLGQDQAEKSEDIPEVDKTPAVSEKGKIYSLGNHRLMCGDALSPEDITALTENKTIDMVFTDPPYNVGYEYNSYDDNKSYKEYKQFCQDFYNLLVPISPFIVITPGTVNLAMWAEIDKWKSIAPWIKRNTMNNGEISNLRLWEPIIFYGKPLKRRPTDLFEHNIMGEESSHTCPKPLELVKDILESFDADTVLDVFGGSGTTLIAADKLGKRCYMLELDPKYVDVIRKRYAKMVGREDDWEIATPEI